MPDLPEAIPSAYPIIEPVESSLSPTSVFNVLINDPHVFFLDSGMDHEKLGRYSFVGSDPFLILKTRGDVVHLTDSNGTTSRNADPFQVVNELLETYHMPASQSPVPFVGGAVGYMGYDMCHFVERLPCKAVDDIRLPTCYLGFYDVIIAFDNLLNKGFIISTGFPELDDEPRFLRASQRLADLKSRLQTPAVLPAVSDTPIAVPANLRFNFTPREYAAAVEKARQYILAGDVFEVNLSQRFESDLTTSPHELYLRLRKLNPAPFACYLGFEDVKVLSASPERFLRKRGDLIETRPIKGTRPRGKTSEEDAILAAKLLASPKDLAEHTMIVDLERNDLGRLCRYGTIRVSELAVLETYPTVFHLTSTIEGRLRNDINIADILRATFPGGSITGAPKIRAMELIDELEPTRRSVYTGSAGYLGFNSDVDLNIIIRTFVVKGDRVYFQAGGAIVYESVPADEYQETLDKAKALFSALNASAP